MKYIPVCAGKVIPLKDIDHPVERVVEYLHGAIPATVYDSLLRAIANEGIDYNALYAAMSAVGVKATRVLSYCPVCGRDKRPNALACDICLQAAKKKVSPEMKNLISLLKELEK